MRKLLKRQEIQKLQIELLLLIYFFEAILL